MARARLLKPEFFRDEELAELPMGARLTFAGLWTLADREGRLEDRPKRIKADLFPWDDVDVSPWLDALASAGFIDRYDVDGVHVIQITQFAKHQKIHVREMPSELPARTSEHGASGTPEHHQGAPKANLGAPKANLGDAEESPRRAKVAGSGSGSGSGSGTPLPPRGRRPSVFDGSLPRDFVNLAWHSPDLGIQVPAAVENKLARLLARRHSGDLEAARAELRAWYPRVAAGLPEAFVVPSDAFRFWQTQFDAAFADKSTPADRVVGPRVPGVDETGEYLAQLRAVR